MIIMDILYFYLERSKVLVIFAKVLNSFLLSYARVAELVDALVSKTNGILPCRFESGPGHWKQHRPPDYQGAFLFYLFRYNFSPDT